jgi:hypothetical protein
MAHLGGAVDSWKDQKVRQALAPLHRMAEETGAAVLVVAHRTMHARELSERARQLAIAEQTLKRARSQLGVESRKSDFGGGWTWSLPAPEADTQAA